MTSMTTNPIFNMGLALIASAAVLTFVAGPAEARSVQVPVAKGELATPEGRAAVDARIADAARRACKRGADVRDLRLHQDIEACVRQARSDARTQVAALIARTQVAAR